MEIFAYAFMQNAFIVGAVVGVLCPVVGLFITLRRLSLVADALSHLCLSGVAAALLAGTHPVLTASAFAVGGGLLLERLRIAYKDYAELSIAVILSGGVALAAVFMGLAGGFNANFMGYLFGSLMVLNSLDMWIITGIGVTVLFLVFLFYKELFYTTFDDEAAQVSGVPVKALGMGFMVLTALTIAVAMKTVGVLLVSSLMILPVAASLRLAVSFLSALLLSVLFSELSVALGLFISFYLNLPPGGTIILTSIAILITVLLVNKKEMWVNNLTGPGQRFFYCPMCGGKLNYQNHHGMYRLTCTLCTYIFYENPIVGVACIAIDDNDRILLGRRKRGQYEGLWCIPCGFVEYEEDVHSAAVREFKEETNLDVKVIRVYSVNSNFHDPGNHTVGIWFLTQVVGGYMEAGDDLDAVNYFDLNNLPPLAFPTDHIVVNQMGKDLERKINSN